MTSPFQRRRARRIEQERRIRPARESCDPHEWELDLDPNTGDSIARCSGCGAVGPRSWTEKPE